MIRRLTMHPGIFARSSILVSSWYLVAFSHAVAQSEIRPHFTTVMPGLEYAHLQITNRPWSIHVARLERSRKGFDVITTLGKGTIEGLSPLAAQIEAVPPKEGHPVVGVNGDFFVIKPGPYQGDPEGLQILEGELVSAPSKVSFWVDHRKFHIEPVNSEFKATLSDGKSTAFGLNETPKADKAVLFTPIFGRSTRATNFLEVVLEKAGDGPWLPLRANQSYRLRVSALNACGNTTLAPGQAVLTIGSRLTNLLSSIKVGGELRISTGLSMDLSGTTAAIGGGPLLVHNGSAERGSASAGTNSAALPRHPRTAIGFSSRYLFLVEVDGRQKELSIGMTFPELAELMKSLGCTEAMNLDGGGSSTFWLNGKVMNSPSDKHERALANAVIIVRK